MSKGMKIVEVVFYKEKCLKELAHSQVVRDEHQSKLDGELELFNNTRNANEGMREWKERNNHYE